MPFIWGPGSLHRGWICHVADASIPGVLLQGKKTPGATTARNDLVLGVEKAGKGGPRAWLMPGHVVDLTCKCSTVFKAWCFLTSTAKKKYIYVKTIVHCQNWCYFKNASLSPTPLKPGYFFLQPSSYSCVSKLRYTTKMAIFVSTENTRFSGSKPLGDFVVFPSILRQPHV